MTTQNIEIIAQDINTLEEWASKCSGSISIEVRNIILVKIQALRVKLERIERLIEAPEQPIWT